MSDFSADDLDFGRSEPAAPPAAAEPASTPASRTVAGERTISPVAGRFGLGKGGKALAGLGLIAGCGVFLAATWTHPNGIKPKAGPQEPARQVVDWSSVKGVAIAAKAPVPPALPDASPASTGAPTLSAPGVGGRPA